MSTLTAQGLAALDRDPAAIRDAARGLTACAGPVADQGAQVARTWRGCAPFYVAPETPVLVAALDPLVADTQATSDRLDRAGRLLGRYADRIEPILAQIKTIVSFSGPVDPATAAAQEQRLNGLLAELSALDLECANALKALVGGAMFNPVPARVKTGETSSKNAGEVTIGVIKIGESITVVETRFSDGKVLFTLTDGGQVGVTVGLGEKAAAGPAGLTAKVELAPGVSFENGSSWLVNGDRAAAFRALFAQYAYRHAASMSPDESAAWGAAVADTLRPLPPLPPPDLVVSNLEVPVELKGTLDAAPPGPVDVAAAGAAGLTAKWTEVRLKDGSVVRTFGGEGRLGGDAGLARDDTDPSFGGNVDHKGVDGGTVSVTRDPSERISRVVLTSSSEIQDGLGDKTGSGVSRKDDSLTAGGSASQKSSTVDVTTTNLAVNDRNRAVVEQWVAQHEGDPDVALGSTSTFYPDTAAPNDPFQNVLHNDAQVSRVRYENVTDKLGFGGEASVGVTAGGEVSGEGTQSHAVSGSYLDRPDVDGHRPERALPRVGG
jgi:hypothetical protein